MREHSGDRLISGSPRLGNAAARPLPSRIAGTHPAMIACTEYCFSFDELSERRLTKCTGQLRRKPPTAGESRRRPNPAVGNALALATFSGRVGIAYMSARPVEAQQQEHKANSQVPAAANSRWRAVK